MKKIILSLLFVSLGCAHQPTETDSLRETIPQVIEKNAGVLRACYIQALDRNKNSSGRIVTEWMLTDQGLATELKIISSDFNDPKFDACIIEVLASIQFPKERPGKTVKIQYPLVFRRAQKAKDASASEVEK